jgi:Zn-dependent protease with chaperone function
MYAIFKSLSVKIPAPEGYRINKTQSPELFDQIESLRKQLNTPKIHEIVITPELNAAIQQTPRLGVFGWHKNSLILGIELLMGLNQKEVLSVIGHELGHLSGGHSKFNGWIYRVRMSWMHIMFTMTQLRGVALWVFGKFFNWYAPYFNAYSFALARANEFEADQIAVEVTSAQDFANGLGKVYVLNERLHQKYWNDLEKKAFFNPKICTSSLTELMQVMQEWKFDEDEVQQCIDKNLKNKTNYGDTHPSLADRLKPLQIQPVFDFDSKKSALQSWFSDSKAVVLEKMDQMWAELNKETWYHLNQQGHQTTERLQELELKPLDNEAMVEKANIIHFLYGHEKSLNLYKQIYNQDTKNPYALFHLGTALVNKQDHKGLKFLDQLMDHEEFMLSAGEVLYDYYKKNNLDQKAHEILLKMEGKQDKNNDYFEEINTLSINDTLVPDDLSEQEFKQTLTLFQQLSYVQQAWIAKKQINTYPNERLYILVYKLKNNDDEERLFKHLEKKWAIESLYFALNHQNKKIAKKIIKIGREIK